LSPKDIRGRSVVRYRLRRNQPAVDQSFENFLSTVSRKKIVAYRLATLWRKGVEIDEMFDLVPRAVCNSRGAHAAVGMADENDIPKILKPKHRQYILNMGFKIYVTMREMRAFAEASVCRGKQFVPPHGHERPHLFPCPASLPTAGCHKKNGQRIHLQSEVLSYTYSTSRF